MLHDRKEWLHLLDGHRVGIGAPNIVCNVLRLISYDRFVTRVRFDDLRSWLSLPRHVEQNIVVIVGVSRIVPSNEILWHDRLLEWQT